MDRIPTPKDLRGAGAVAVSLAYVSGVAGIIAGALLFREGQTAFAVVAWALTFAAGAILMIASFLVRGLAALLARQARLESDVGVLLADAARERGYEPDRDPWSRHPPPT